MPSPLPSQSPALSSADFVLETDPSRDALLTDFGRATLDDAYLLPGEGPQDRFAAVASYFADDRSHAVRMYDYISRMWMMPSTPILSNGGTDRGMPISCFVNEADDTLSGIKGLWNENIELASKGGGIGSYWGNLRSIGERVGQNGKTSGIMPFVKVMDSLTLAISQGSLRRGSGAAYLPVSHPEIEEFIEMRRPHGGDPNRRSTNIHHGVVISDDFMASVDADAMWDLRSPKDGSVVRSVPARDLWIRLLVARMETGEPYMLFIDTVNRSIPEHHRRSGLIVKTSNLCAEITLPTGTDHLGQQRTAVCCLSSVNLEKFEEWKDDPVFIEDVFRFLDNVLSDFIVRAPSERRRGSREFIAPLLDQMTGILGAGAEARMVKQLLVEAADRHFSGLMDRAIYAAERERSVGLGAMGFHSFLQSRGIPFDSPAARMWNKRFFRHIRERADAASRKLAMERGPCPDAAEHGILERFSNKMAIAPTASASVVAGQASPGIDPVVTNAHNEKRKNGSFIVRNKNLRLVLEKHGRDDEPTWRSIARNEGSVAHLDFLTDHERLVFRTAYEIDQMAVIDMAADRAPFVDQSQSVNIFMRANVHKTTLHDVHRAAHAKGLKSLYYLRSLSVHRAENVTGDASPQLLRPTLEPECLACQ